MSSLPIMIAMSSQPLLNDDCVLLANIDLNSARICHILERRFSSNCHRTSFDFKAFRPERPSNNAKVSRSLLRFNPSFKAIDAADEYSSSDSSLSEEEETVEEEDRKPEDLTSTDNDDYLNELAEWEPNKVLPIIEDDDDEEDDDDDDNTTLPSMDSSPDLQDGIMDISPDTSTIPVDDLHVTYVHRPVKPEPTISADLPQLDGQIDLLPDNAPSSSKPVGDEERLMETVARINARPRSRPKAIELFTVPPLVNRYPSSTTKRTRKKPTTPKKSLSLSSSTAPHKRDQTSEVKVTNSVKKFKPPLQSKLLKENDCAIRALSTPICPKQQRPVQASKSISSVESNSSVPVKGSPDVGRKPKSHTASDPRKAQRSVSHDLVKPSQRHSNSSTMQKLPHQRSTFVPKEKSASDHMTIAERELNRRKQTEHSTSVVAKVSSAKERVSTDSSSCKSVPIVKKKSVSTLPQTIDPAVRRTQSTGESSSVTQDKLSLKMKMKMKKKKKKLKRLTMDLPDLLACDSPVSNERRSSGTERPSRIDDQYTLSPRSPSHQASPMNGSGCSVTEKYTVNEPKETAPSSSCETLSRPADFFDDCIVIDDDDDFGAICERNSSIDTVDDDIQEIKQQCYSIAYNIRVREKLLDHSVRSSVMRIKWLFNLEYLLLEHILICHEENVPPSPNNSLAIKSEPSTTLPSSSSYRIDPSFISIIIINFIKMFILRNSLSDQQELSFVQFGFTSHLRYLLLELPTYNHLDVPDAQECCSECHQYALMINILFDLLFDLLEHDLCEITRKSQYRSSLIEDDYFHQFLYSKQTRKSSSHRIRFVVYLIELLAMHVKKCTQKKQFQFTKSESKLFHPLEGFIRHILQQSSKTSSDVSERLSICFDILELCFLFVDGKDFRLRQVAEFLTTLCGDNVSHLNLILCNTHLLPDIRLLLINELMEKRFQLKLRTINHVHEFSRKIEVLFAPLTPIDDFTLVLLRSLFNTYADLIIDIKPVHFMYSESAQQLKGVLEQQLNSIYNGLIKISIKPIYLEQTRRTLILFHLLTRKWNSL